MKKNNHYQIVILACIIGSIVSVSCLTYSNLGYEYSDKWFDFRRRGAPFEFDKSYFGWPYHIQEIVQRKTLFRLAQPEVKYLPPGTSVAALLKSFTKRSAEIPYVKQRQQKNAIVMLVISISAGLYSYFRMHSWERLLRQKSKLKSAVLILESLVFAALFVAMFRFHLVDWKYPFLFLISFGAYSTLMVTILCFFWFTKKVSSILEKI